MKITVFKNRIFTLSIVINLVGFALSYWYAVESNRGDFHALQVFISTLTVSLIEFTRIFESDIVMKILPMFALLINLAMLSIYIYLKF